MTDTKFIVPLSYDFMFKALFGNEKNIKILTRFISDYFNIEYKNLIGKIKILNNELMKNDKKDKKKSVDVIVELNDKEILNLEMNANKDYPGLIERNTAYICKVYSEQYITGESYQKTKKCIQINLNNFSITKDKDKILVYKLRDEENKSVLTDNLEIHHINIELLKETCYNETTKNYLDKWIEIFKSRNVEELRRNSSFMKEIGEELVDEVERLSSEKHIIGLYDGELHEKKVRQSYIDDAIEKGLAKGLEKGLEKGIKQGISQGIVQGGTQKAKDIVINMLKENIDISIISKVTGLDIKNIEQIKNTTRKD